MKILMVRPAPSPETIGLQHLMIVEPLELEILCALKRDEDDAVIIDLILEKKSFESFILDHKPEILCITGYITNVSTIIDYCRKAKEILNSVVTIVGGVHCEVCPEDFDNESIDFRVIRNASTIFTHLLNHIDKKSPLPPSVLIKGKKPEDIVLPPFEFIVPFPDRTVSSKYRNRYFYIFQEKVALIKTAFGCPFTCSFCFCRLITGGQHFQRPVREVIDELEMIKEKEIYIVDDDFLVNKGWLNNFISEIKIRKINKRFLVYGRADFIAKNPEMMHELANVGLRTVIVGFESFSEKELSRYNKNVSVDLYKETMQVLYKEKIDCFATIIIPPHWDKADFKNMVRAVRSLGIYFVNLQPLTPLPKTDIQFPSDRIIIKKDEYEKWDLAHVSVRPDKLSVAEFYKEILKAYNSILFHPGVLWKYLTTYKTLALLKMLKGSIRVSRQYKLKIKEAQKYA